jgi:hypothetical protein
MSPTFVFSVSASVRKKCGYERKLLETFVLVVVHRVFYSHFIISLKKYDMVAKTFASNKFWSSMSFQNLVRLSQI